MDYYYLSVLNPLFSLFFFCSRYMRTECLNYQYAHDSALPVCRLIANVGNKMQSSTQRYDRRPYGVGLLVAGYDVCTLKTIISFKVPNL